MKRVSYLLATAAALVLVLAACSSVPKQTDAQRLELYRTHAGEPVNEFRYFGTLNGWTPLGDQALAVWTRPNEAFLLELTAHCQDLDFAPAISVTNMMGTVSARFDDVIVRGGSRGVGRIPCRIDTIRPLDVKALKEAQRELREAQAVERQTQQTPPQN